MPKIISLMKKLLVGQDLTPRTRLESFLEAFSMRREFGARLEEFAIKHLFRYAHIDKELSSALESIYNEWRCRIITTIQAIEKLEQLPIANSPNISAESSDYCAYLAVTFAIDWTTHKTKEVIEYCLNSVYRSTDPDQAEERTDSFSRQINAFIMSVFAEYQE